MSLAVVFIMTATGCEKKPDVKTPQPEVVESKTELAPNAFSAEIVPVSIVLPECKGQLCPQIKIQRLQSNYPELDQAVDRYIEQYVAGLVSGFNFDQITYKNQEKTQTGSPITTMTAQQGQNNKAPAQRESVESEPENPLQDDIDKFLILAEEVKSLGSSAQLNLYLKPQALNPNSPVVTVVMNASHYIGGAHGSSAQQYLNFEISSQLILSLDQIIETGQRKAFNDLAYAAFEQWIQQTQPDMDLKTYQELWKFTLSENFYLSSKGLILQYGEYDIGPYAVGLPRLLISYEDLKGILKPQYLPVIKEKADTATAVQSKEPAVKS